jgi:multidrug resistance efflux pump
LDQRQFPREQLGEHQTDSPVELVLDVLPGRIFLGKVQSVGWGVSQGSIDPTTGLPKIGEPMGLVCNPQRFTVRVNLDENKYVPGMRYGSQANVIVYGTNNSIVNAIGAVFMRLVAVLTYVS